ncbi:SRPBCC domain-containing protein [Aquimarina sp. AU119]|uniref:SRPBCC family protein n=1 Tax=Aquimarina sp. AU119 TaxID=2108528 RepID=UPI000D696B29|nr:SRPBCC domain-containing protein [Aquimarina sp. AU119]
MGTFSIYHDLFILASIKEVFDGVSVPDHLVNWWPKKCTGTPELEQEYNFYFPPEYDWYGKVTTCKPNKSFHITMTKSDKDWNNTSFGFDLEEIKDGVQLKFWHKGWPKCNDEFRQSSFCWAMLLSGLKNYIEKGIIIPFQERE